MQDNLVFLLVIAPTTHPLVILFSFLFHKHDELTKRVNTYDIVVSS